MRRPRSKDPNWRQQNFVGARVCKVTLLIYILRYKSFWNSSSDSKIIFSQLSVCLVNCPTLFYERAENIRNGIFIKTEHY